MTNYKNAYKVIRSINNNFHKDTSYYCKGNWNNGVGQIQADKRDWVWMCDGIRRTCQELESKNHRHSLDKPNLNHSVRPSIVHKTVILHLSDNFFLIL